MNTAFRQVRACVVSSQGSAWAGRMLRLAIAVLLLSTLALPLAAAEEELRVVVYCDTPGSCPGVSGGDRTEGCGDTGNVGAAPCLYTDGGVGVGVVVDPTVILATACDDIRYCIGASLTPDSRCNGGQRIRVFSHIGQVNVEECMNRIQWEPIPL